MKANTYLIQFTCMCLIIFGGTFTIRLIRTGDFLIDQLIGTSIGIIILLVSIIWRKTKMHHNEN
ncbi:hypothetical protein [Gottfriedia luciferensis]|uniref:hypothetical protein n=1 Tax=Gottfriedia luciferensis TaxID=178774 RepID=UPI000B454DE7|nr:hypothetical protein [Gottfriedia luciferensis]